LILFGNYFLIPSLDSVWLNQAVAQARLMQQKSDEQLI